MSERLRGVVVTHGSLAESLVDAVASIIGPETGLVAVSNHGCSAESLQERIRQAMRDDPCVLFIDMAGGSCFMAAARGIRERPETRVVAGVNLPMLLDFVRHRELDLDAVTTRLLDAGTKAIRTIPS